MDSDGKIIVCRGWSWVVVRFSNASHVFIIAIMTAKLENCFIMFNDKNVLSSSYQNVKKSTATSKAQSQYLNHNHKLHMLYLQMFVERKVEEFNKVYYKESATASVL